MTGNWDRISRPRVGGVEGMGINVAVTVGLVVVGLLAGALVPASAPAYRVVPVMVALVIGAAVTVDLVAMALATTVGYLAAIGFLVNRLGELSWHGMPDFGRLLALVLSSLAGLALGLGRRRRRVSPAMRPAVPPEMSSMDRRTEMAEIEMEADRG